MPPLHIKLGLIKQFVKALDRNLQGVKKVPDPKQNYIGLMTEG